LGKVGVSLNILRTSVNHFSPQKYQPNAAGSSKVSYPSSIALQDSSIEPTPLTDAFIDRFALWLTKNEGMANPEPYTRALPSLYTTLVRYLHSTTTPITPVLKAVLEPGTKDIDVLNLFDNSRDLLKEKQLVVPQREREAFRLMTDYALDMKQRMLTGDSSGTNPLGDGEGGGGSRKRPRRRRHGGQ